MTDKKVVLITGGAMGQGAMHAIEFAKIGYDCVLLDMLDPTDERFAATVAEVEALGATVLPIKTNICSTPDMEAAFAAAWEKFGMQRSTCASRVMGASSTFRAFPA